MKKSFIFIYLIINIFGSICYSQISKELIIKKEEVNTDSLLNINSKSKNRFESIPPPPPPHPPPPLSASEEIEKSRILDSINDVKLKNYIIKTELSTYKIVQNSLIGIKPCVEVFSIEKSNFDWLNNIKNLECSNLVNRNTMFNLKIIDDCLKKSHEIKNLDYGELFCIGNFETNAEGLKKIVFKKSEGGGHYDGIALFTILKDQNKFFRLPLYYHYGGEGYDIVIESEFKNNVVKRIIIERFGWSSTTDEALDKQPRSETKQSFKITENGEIILIKNKTSYFDCEKYMN